MDTRFVRGEKVEALDVDTLVWRVAFIKEITSTKVTFDFFTFPKHKRFNTVFLSLKDAKTETNWPMRKPLSQDNRHSSSTHPFLRSTREMLAVKYNPATLVYPDKVFVNRSGK